MKNTITIILLLILLSFKSFSQFAPTGIRTDPDDPFNPERDDITYNFDWRMVNDEYHYFQVYNAENFNKILNPFFLSGQTLPYWTLAGWEGSDYQPQDGWELFYVNLGINLDGTDRDEVYSPKLILYNKYESVLRVFMAIHDNIVSNHAVVNMEFFDDEEGFYKSALFSNISNVKQPLSDSTNNISISFPTKATNNDDLFFHVDIPLAYDPCACFYQSKIRLFSKFLTESDINLTGELLGSIKVLQTGGSESVKALNFVAGIANIAGGIATQNPGFYVAAVRNFASFYKSVSSSSIPDIDSQLKVFEKYLKKDPLNYPPKDSIKLAKETFAMISDFFSATIKQAEQKKSTTSIHGSMHLTGTVTTANEVGESDVFFSSPRSPGSSTNNFESAGNVDPEYTPYNELLGLFALLKRPKGIRSFNTSFTSIVNPYYTLYEYHTRQKIKLNEAITSQIEYVFNNAANVNVNKTKIKVAIVVHSSSEPRGYKNLVLVDAVNNNYILHSPFVPLNRIGNLSVSFINDVTFPSSNIPDSYFNELHKYNVYLKFMIEYEFNSIGTDGEPNKAFHVYKYPIDIEEVSAPINVVEINNEDVLIMYETFDSDTTISTTGNIYIIGDITGTNNAVININAGNNLIFGWGNNVSTSGNAVINFNIAGDIIYYSGVTEFNPNVNLEYDEYPVLPFDAEIPPITDSIYVANFCQSEQYKARYAKGSSNKKLAKNNKKNNNTIVLYENDFAIYPNPANETVTVSLLTQVNEKLSLSITDISGKEYHREIINSQKARYYKQKINISNYPPGIYLIKITGNQFTQTKKLIKN